MVEPGSQIRGSGTLNELHVGGRSVFQAAWFTEISRDGPPTAFQPGVAAVVALNPVVDVLAYSPEQQQVFEQDAGIAAGRAQACRTRIPLPRPAGRFDDVIHATAEFLLDRLAAPTRTQPTRSKRRRLLWLDMAELASRRSLRHRPTRLRRCALRGARLCLPLGQVRIFAISRPWTVRP